MNIHHIGFEVSNLEKIVQLLKGQFGMKIVRELNWCDEHLIFLSNGKKLLIELVQGDQFEEHVAYYVENLQGWIHTNQDKIIEGPFPVLNGETAFVKTKNHWYEVCSFTIN